MEIFVRLIAGIPWRMSGWWEHTSRHSVGTKSSLTISGSWRVPCYLDFTPGSCRPAAAQQIASTRTQIIKISVWTLRQLLLYRAEHSELTLHDFAFFGQCQETSHPSLAGSDSLQACHAGLLDPYQCQGKTGVLEQILEK